MEVTVTIGPDGKSTIDISGAVGRECEGVTEAVTKALGGDVLDTQHKPEWYTDETAASEGVRGW